MRGKIEADARGGVTALQEHPIRIAFCDAIDLL
jgi:hypothetical protein